jgi:hypothetical protein
MDEDCRLRSAIGYAGLGHIRLPWSGCGQKSCRSRRYFAMSDADDIVEAFLVESAENLARFDRNLMELEKHPDDREIVADIFAPFLPSRARPGFWRLPSWRR